MAFNKKKVLSTGWLMTRLVLTIIAIALVMSRIQLQVISEELLHVNLAQYFLATIVFAAIIFASTINNYIILNAVDVKYGFVRVLKINYLSFFFSLFSMLVGSISRFLTISGNAGRRGEAVFVMIVERMQLLLTLSLMLVGFTLWTRDESIFASRQNSASFIILTSIFIGVLILNLLLVTRFDIKIPAFFSKKKSKVFEFLKSKIHDLVRIRNTFSTKQASVALSLLASLCIPVFGCIFFYFIFNSFNVSIKISALIYIYTLVTFIQLIPLTIYGLGLREGALIIMLKDFSVSTEQATLIGLSMFIPCILHAILGGIWFVSSPKTSG